MLTNDASAQNTKASNTTDVNTNWADNTIGSITPTIARATLLRLVNSMQQYAAVNAQTGTTYTFVVADYGQLVTFNNAGAVAVTLPQATGSFATFNVYVRNLGAGTVTITPTTSTIDGVASLPLPQGGFAWIISDGTNYRTWIGSSVSVTWSSPQSIVTDTAGVNFTVTGNGTNAATVQVNKSGGTQFQVSTGSASATIKTVTNDPMIIGIGNVEVGRILQGFMLGTTTDPGAAAIAQTLGANNLTGQLIKRNTDISPTGKFQDFQNAAGASLWSVDITGTLTKGSTGAGFTVALGTSTITGILGGANGGAGVNNGANTITLGNNLTTSGNFALTLTATAITNATLPGGTHTLAGLDVAQTWSAVQSFNSGNLKLNGATSGALTMNCAATCGTNTITWPAGTTDFSATGGASNVVKQTSAGGPLTVAQLAFSDVSGTATVAQGGTGDTGTAWSQTTPTPTCGTGTFTVTPTSTVRVKTLGKTVFFTVVISDGTNVGTCAQDLRIVLPNTANSDAISVGRESGGGGIIQGRITSASATLIITKGDGTAPNIANGIMQTVTGVYESQ